ncbi:hypothetical protein [Dyadobacter sp. LHD-138]|uniref:hypothetical protein n=1 Tax=Dyadobacter sp. LHD-138 TaxID=3071413 RepID=UPI0027DEB0AA|nr:hypothetical protein [Dyadobacter sp. LHD-138]MDQ6482571.1 hypothetical protein [Dyadobacter sp. LHD-138]
MKISILTAFLALITFCSFGQNFLLERGQSGAHIGGQLGFGKGSTILGISPGFTWDGKLTLSLTGGHERNNDYGITSNSIKPSLSYMVVKQDNEGIPLSVSLGASYQFNFFPDDKDLKAHTLGLDVGLFHRLYLNDQISIIPGALVGWAQTTAKYTGYEDEKVSGVIGAFQTSLLVNQFHITPSVQFSKNATVFNLLIGYIFPF